MGSKRIAGRWPMLFVVAASLSLGTAAVAAPPPAPAQPQAPPATAQPQQRVDDMVVAWVGRLRAEAEALRTEGAQPVVEALQRMIEAEVRLLERLRVGERVDDVLPEMARTWGENAELLARQSARMPEIMAAQRQRLANARGLLGQAQAARRGLDVEAVGMRTQLEQLRARQRAAGPGSPEAVKAEVEAAAQAAALTAREAQARLVAGFAAQAAQLLQRLEEASRGMDMLATAIAAHQRVLQASADLARTRLAAREVLEMLAGVAEGMEGFETVFQGLAQHWQTLDGLLQRLGDLPADLGGARS